MNGHTSCQITEWRSDEWCVVDPCRKNIKATSQEKLQEIASKISRNCKVADIKDNGHNICTIYENNSLNIRYWVKDSFGHISEIIEARYFC